MNNYFKNIIIKLPRLSASPVRVQIFATTSDFRVEHVNSVIQNWKQLGQSGAFCQAQRLPEESRVSVEPSGIESDSSYAWHVHLQNCDNRCLIVLANVIVDAGYKWNPESEVMESMITRIEIGPLNDASDYEHVEVGEPGFEFTDRKYPQLSETLKTLVRFEGVASVKTFRRVVIEFKMPVAEHRFDEVTDLMDLWGKVVRHGYPKSLEDLYFGDSSIESIHVDLFDENTIEIKIDTFGGSESVWNSLANVLGPKRADLKFIRIY